MTGSDWDFGDILLVSFPFTNQQGAKRRPTVVVSSTAYQRERADTILMPITSQVGGAMRFGEVTVRDWQAAGLLAPSRVKPILFTAEATLVRKCIGQLSAHDKKQLRSELATLIG